MLEFKPITVRAIDAPARSQSTTYPPLLARRVAGRVKRPLGNIFGLTRFGVNLTRLAPGAASSLRHAHSRQDEFVYVIEGRPTLHSDDGKVTLERGMCAGFAAGTGNAHSLINETDADVLYLEIGDRTEGDTVSYPDDDLCACLVDGRWIFTRKDGTPY